MPKLHLFQILNVYFHREGLKSQSERGSRVFFFFIVLGGRVVRGNVLVWEERMERNGKNHFRIFFPSPYLRVLMEGIESSFSYLRV